MSYVNTKEKPRYCSYCGNDKLNVEKYKEPINLALVEGIYKTLQELSPTQLKLPLKVEIDGQVAEISHYEIWGDNWYFVKREDIEECSIETAGACKDKIISKAQDFVPEMTPYERGIDLACRYKVYFYNDYYIDKTPDREEAIKEIKEIEIRKDGVYFITAP